MTRPARVACLLVVTAFAAVPAGGASARASAVPEACPSKAVLKRTIHVTVRRLASRVRPVGTVALAGGFGAPTSTTPAKSDGEERTCTYTTQAAPVTIAFTSPVTAAVFARARTSTARTTDVATVRGVGDSAWAMAGGQLFVLEGTLELVISAPGAGAGELSQLARASL